MEWVQTFNFGRDLLLPARKSKKACCEVNLIDGCTKINLLGFNTIVSTALNHAPLAHSLRQRPDGIVFGQVENGMA